MHMHRNKVNYIWYFAFDLRYVHMKVSHINFSTKVCVDTYLKNLMASNISVENGWPTSHTFPHFSAKECSGSQSWSEECVSEVLQGVI